MIKLNRTPRALLLMAAGAALLIAFSVHKLGAADTPGKLIATVDLSKIYSPDWTRFKSETQRLDQERSNFKSVIDDVVPNGGGDAAIPPIDSATIKKWMDLKLDITTNPQGASKAKQDQLVAYENQGKAATDAINIIIAKGDKMTADEKTQYNALTALRQTAADTINKQAADYTQQLSSDATAARKDLDAAVDEAIKTVATDKKVTYVLNSPIVNSQGQAQPVLLFSSDTDIDITQDVLKKLK